MSTDTAVCRALARKEILQREIESRQLEMRDIDTFLALYDRFGGGEDKVTPRGADKAQSEPGPAQPKEPHERSRPPGNGSISQEQFIRDARRLLIENARPMKRGQLIKSFHNHGLRVGGNDEVKNFGTKIWKARDLFINLPGEGYWPRDVSCHAVGYEPKDKPGAGVDSMASQNRDGLFSRAGQAA